MEKTIPVANHAIAKPPRVRMRVIIVLAVAAFFAVAVHGHLLSVNNYYYYSWPWKWSPSIYVYPIIIPLGVPLLVAQFVYRKNRALAVALITLSAFALMVGAAVVQNNPPSFSRITDIVASRWSTGYFASAAGIVQQNFPMRELLRRYPTLLDHFYLHPRQKPPGILLFEIAVIHLFGTGSPGMMISGLLTGLIAATGVPLTYLFITIHTENRDAGFLGATFFALCPSLLLFFPDFDPTFPVLTCALAIFWALAIKQKRAIFGILFGLTYALTGLITYLPGILPIFFAGYTFILSRSDPKFRWKEVAKQLAFALAVFSAFYLLLWLATGFDPFTTLRECARQNAILWDKLIYNIGYPRHSLPWTFFTDLYDFALGSAWISFVIAGFYFTTAIKNGLTLESQIAIAAVSQFLIIAIIGLLQTESARIWIFMYPMLMLPIGLELTTWPPRARLAVFAAALLITAAMCQSMQFMISTY
jgi:hypothetical protein